LLEQKKTPFQETTNAITNFWETTSIDQGTDPKQAAGLKSEYLSAKWTSEDGKHSEYFIEDGKERDGPLKRTLGARLYDNKKMEEFGRPALSLGQSVRTADLRFDIYRSWKVDTIIKYTPISKDGKERLETKSYTLKPQEYQPIPRPGPGIEMWVYALGLFGACAIPTILFISFLVIKAIIKTVKVEKKTYTDI